MNFKKYNSDVVLVAHFLMGILAGSIPSLVFTWVFGSFFLGVFMALTKSKRYPEYLFAAYLSGIELLGRMSSSGIPHEFIKYSVIVILVVGLFRTHKRIAYSFIIFIIMLIPGAFLTDGGGFEETRQLISANLTGPFCLAISVLYFYQRPFDGLALKRLFLFILFPLASILGYLLIRTPDFSKIEFGFQSNFVTSIYGPNQMSSILGLGILLVGLCYFLRIRLFGSNIIAFFFIGFLLFRGLLTFSRGGMITVLILLTVIFIYVICKVAGLNKITLQVMFLASIFSFFAMVLFQYTDDLTGNRLSDRYKGVKRGRQIEDIDKLTSGRTMIVYLDWQIFKDNPTLGVGVGMGKELRKKYGYVMEVAAHNEFSRILAEHGMFGIVALLIMIFFPFKHFFSSNKIQERILLIALIGFCFVFMTHSATRIAAPCFLYGIAFIKIVNSLSSTLRNDYLPRQQAVKAWQNSLGHRATYSKTI